MLGKGIRVSGTVQGVGFRPYVWRLAQQYQLKGYVGNDAGGVFIRVWGEAEALAAFIEQLPLQAPPLARISEVACSELTGLPEFEDFRIIASQSGHSETAVAADAATCPACLADIADPANRRYRYPFTNCTHCGPRLSIVRGVPFDRCNTSMAAFAMCPDCQAEYDDPADRRFHAQANCCPACGPKLCLVDGQGTIGLSESDSIEQTAVLLRQGHIVAIKGLGGFHLACDASNTSAVNNLRQRKHRYAKPFALMARDLTMLRRFATVSDSEIQVLQEQAAPIVLLQAAGESLAPGIAPDDDKLGFMLPYTPLHTVLMQHLETPIVLTSGNLSDEPQCISNDEAKHKLAGIADFFLLHDRDIVNRLDDSVLRMMAGQPRMLRRARGYAPQPVTLPPGFADLPPLLAMGGELKNTFCLLKNAEAMLSPHIGDLEQPQVQHDYRRQLALYQQLFDCQPKAIAVDLHSDYLSTQLGRLWAEQQNLPLLTVQHHHAHIAACMAEHGLAIDHPPLLGVAMDGLGLGDDGQLWGGEFLHVDYRQCNRLANFDAVALLGGTQAMHQPWRNSYAQLKRYFDWPTLSQDYAELAIIQFLNRQQLPVLDAMLSKGLNSPLSSSCGRLFDALAAALGLCCEAVSHEAQAAMALESLATPVFEQQRQHAYACPPFPDGPQPILRWHPLWQQVLDDLQRGTSKAEIAARIHHALAQTIANTTMVLSRQIATTTVALSGGVFQNRLLLEEVVGLLSATGISVLHPAQLPSNDGGLALGQAMVAAARLSNR